jgi:hypothetical protein
LGLGNGFISTLWKKSFMEIIGKHPKLAVLRTLLLADGMLSPELE